MSNRMRSLRPVRFGPHGGGCVCDGFANGVWVRHIANLVGQLGNVAHQIDDLADHVDKLTGPIGNLVRHIASLVRPIGNWTGQIAKLMVRDGNDGYA
mgnify:FL=1